MPEFKGFLPKGETGLDEVTTGHHVINVERDMSISGQDVNGGTFQLSAFRRDKDSDDGQSVTANALYKPVDGELISDEVRLKTRIKAFGNTTMEVIERNKGKAVVVGSLVVGLVAGAGLLVKRRRR